MNNQAIKTFKEIVTEIKQQQQSKRCDVLVKGCLQCQQTGQKCTKCDIDGHWQINNKDKCQCQQAYYQQYNNQCVPCSTQGCLECPTFDICITCQQTYTLSDNKCISKATYGAFIDAIVSFLLLMVIVAVMIQCRRRQNKRQIRRGSSLGLQETSKETGGNRMSYLQMMFN